MVDLESPAWNNIVASCGGSGSSTANLLRSLAAGDVSKWGKFYHEVCHQHTIGEVAFVAAPHIVAIVRNATPHLRALMLSTIGSIVASANLYNRSAAMLRDEWKADFEQACDDARKLAAECLQEGVFIGRVVNPLEAR